MKSEQQEAVQRRAYELWQAAGYPEGQALEHWLQAERELGLPPRKYATAGAADRAASGERYA